MVVVTFWGVPQERSASLESDRAKCSTNPACVSDPCRRLQVLIMTWEKASALELDPYAATAFAPARPALALKRGDA